MEILQSQYITCTGITESRLSGIKRPIGTHITDANTTTVRGTDTTTDTGRGIHRSTQHICCKKINYQYPTHSDAATRSMEVVKNKRNCSNIQTPTLPSKSHFCDLIKNSRLTHSMPCRAYESKLLYSDVNFFMLCSNTIPVRQTCQLRKSFTGSSGINSFIFQYVTNPATAGNLVPNDSFTTGKFAEPVRSSMISMITVANSHEHMITVSRGMITYDCSMTGMIKNVSECRETLAI